MSSRFNRLKSWWGRLRKKRSRSPTTTPTKRSFTSASSTWSSGESHTRILITQEELYGDSQQVFTVFFSCNERALLCNQKSVLSILFCIISDVKVREEEEKSPAIISKIISVKPFFAHLCFVFQDAVLCKGKLRLWYLPCHQEPGALQQEGQTFFHRLYQSDTKDHRVLWVTKADPNVISYCPV